jgi:hypothetical protein
MQPGHIELENDIYTRVGRLWVFLPNEIKGWIILGQVLLEEVLIFVTAPVECLFRHRFGTRALSLFLVIQIASWAYLGLLFGGAGHPIIVGVLTVSAIAAIYHYREARVWEKKSQPPRHSYDPGTPLPIWLPIRAFFSMRGMNANRWLSDGKIMRFGEPAICLLAGLLLSPVERLLSHYLLVCSAGLLMKGHIKYLRLVNMRRDRADGRIIAAWMSGQNENQQIAEEKVFLVSVAPCRHPLKSPAVEAPPSDEMQPASSTAPTESAQQGTEEISVPPAKDSETTALSCESCGRLLRVKPKHRGKKCTCPSCKAAVLVPAA